jgi:SLOG cluster2
VSSLDLVSEDALAGIAVGISVSDSADLGRLGLAQQHAEFAVGELARAVLVAGGSLVYGGRIRPSGFTQFLLHEVRRYGTQGRLVICLAEHEHSKLSFRELDELDRALGSLGTVECLRRDGSIVDDVFQTKADEPAPIEDPEARVAGYSGLRRRITERSDVRVVVGGQLHGYSGARPGVIEEAGLALAAGQPLYCSAGFGGAAAVVASALGLEGTGWMPDGFPQAESELLVDWANYVEQSAKSGSWTRDLDGLSAKERSSLIATYRAGEIAAYAVRGLSRVADRLRGPQTQPSEH